MLDAASGNPVTFTTAIDLVRPSGTIVAAGFKSRPVEGFDVLERFEEALALLDRRLPGRDAVRVSLPIS